MINTKSKLNIQSYISSVYSDLSFECADSTRDTASVTLTSSDSVFVGFYKPINQIYLSLTTPNTNANTLTVQYWNGSAFTNVTDKFDDTKGLTRSGFIKWDRNQTTEAKTTINSLELYWYKLTPSVTTSATVIQTITCLFADDNDISIEVADIADSNHLQGKTSHLNIHIAVRNQIIQTLRNKNYSVTNIDGTDKELTAWDLLELEQVKQAAIFLALYKIYFNLSDSETNKFAIASKHYFERYQDAFNLVTLSVDEDDDGVQDEHEQRPEIKTLRVSR